MRPTTIGNANLGKHQPKRTENLSLATMDLDEFMAKEALSFIEKRKHMMILLGRSGSGKTYFSIALGNYFLKKYMEKRTVKTNLFEVTEYHYPSAIYLPFCAYFNELRDTFDKRSQCTEQEIKDKYFDADFLILDDLGSGTNKEWEEKIVFEIIDYRWLHELPTVITSNLTLDEIERIFHQRTRSRLEDSRNKKYFDWETDRRILPGRK